MSAVDAADAIRSGTITAETLAAADGEGDVVHGGNTVESLGDALEGQQ